MDINMDSLYIYINKNKNKNIIVSFFSTQYTFFLVNLITNKTVYKKSVMKYRIIKGIKGEYISKLI